MGTNQITTFIERIESAGFGLELEGDGLAIISDRAPSDDQLKFLKDHKSEIVQALRARVLEGDGQAANDLLPVNDEIATISIEAHTPAGNKVLVHATDVTRAEWFRANNPKSETIPDKVQCKACLNAIATPHPMLVDCVANVIPHGSAGHWKTDKRYCLYFNGIESVLEVRNDSIT